MIRKKLKKMVASVMCSAILLGVHSSITRAEEADSAIYNTMAVDIQFDYSSAEKNIDGTTSYNVVNAEQVAAYYGVENPKAVKVTTFMEQKEE